MSLQSDLDTACASLHAVHNGGLVGETGHYNFVGIQGVNRISWGKSFLCQLRWTWTTPPCYIQLDFHEANPLFVMSTPVFTLFGTCNECDEGIEHFGTVHCFRMATLAYRMYVGQQYNLQTAHIQYKGTNAGSIAFYLTGL
jgi:hypothetical protein